MNQFNITGIGKLVRIYFGEGDQWQGRPLYMALLETLRAEGCAGATVLRGIAGFGANSRIHTAMILRLSEDLPIIVEWVDTPHRVERVLPKIVPMVANGLITVAEVQIAHHQHRKVDDFGLRLRAREIMSRDIVTLRPEMPLREAVELLVARGQRAAPVVDAEGRVRGIVTNGDIIERGGLRWRVEMLRVLTHETLAEALATVEDERTVADVMTEDVVTIKPETTLAEAAHTMVSRGLKRLPVVGPDGVLVGMVSRVDLLQTRSEAYPRPTEEGPAKAGPTIGDIMHTDMPVVRSSASLAEVLAAITSTRLNRTLVLDQNGRVIGRITDAELVRRLSPRDHPSLLQLLISRLPFTYLSEAERHNLERAVGNTAEALMIPDIVTVSADTPVAEAIAIMVRDRLKVLPVVDKDGKFLGAVDRADVLRLLAEPKSSSA